MNQSQAPATNSAPQLPARADELFRAQQNAIFEQTDRLFAWLLLGEWLAGIVVALVISPTAWAGRSNEPHLHVWTAIFLGFAIVSLPVWLAVKYPGRTITRHIIAVAQMIYSALLIHLSGGRIETHFHVFGSLAFLSFYRDWRVLASASAVVALDHSLRGLLLPESVYGVLTFEPWRWLEHTWWVVFEDVFLIKSCCDQVKEMQSIALRQFEVEETRARVEELVDERTQELRASQIENAHLANIVQSSHDAIVGRKPDGTIVSWNRGAEQMFGYSFEAMREAGVKQLFADPNALDVAEFFQNMNIECSTEEFETVFSKKDGQLIDVAIVRSPVRDSDGNSLGTSAIIRDVTERRAAERRVSEFYSIVSHELRTPLTSIRGALGLIKGGMVDPEESKDLVQVACDSADRLVRLINDILDLKKIQSGKMDLELTRINCVDLVRQTLKSLTGFAEESGVTLADEIRAPGTVLGDQD
ncbi:MAG: PAS domain S-box protein, partial [Terriglobales bacterium]